MDFVGYLIGGTPAPYGGILNLVDFSGIGGAVAVTPAATPTATPTTTSGTGGLGRILRPRLKRHPVFHDEETMLFDLI